MSRSRSPVPGDGSSSSQRRKHRVTVPPVQRPSPGALSVAEPGDRERRPFAASARAPGRPALDDRQVPRAGVAFHPATVTGMPGIALPARAADAGDAGSGQSWHPIGVPGGGRRRRIAGPIPAQTCGQATVTLTWMPGRQARRPASGPAASWNHAGERSRPGRRPSRSPSLPARTRRPTAPSSATYALPVGPARLTQSG